MHGVVCITHVWMHTYVFEYPMYCKCVCVCVSVEAAPTATLFINTSVGLTVHSGREGEPRDSLGQRSHKKSLLIYFPPNWKMHAHTWLNHHASTGDGPPLNADETWSQFCCADPSQAWQKKHNVTLHTHSLMASTDVLLPIARLKPYPFTPPSFPQARSGSPWPTGLYPIFHFTPFLRFAWPPHALCFFRPPHPPLSGPLLLFHSHFLIYFHPNWSVLPCLLSFVTPLRYLDSTYHWKISFPPTWTWQSETRQALNKQPGWPVGLVQFVCVT